VPEARKFARLRAEPGAGDVEVPGDGMCLSTFLVLRSPTAPREVLVGRIDPSGPWWEVAGLDSARVTRIGDRWILPATQLLLFEGPQEAAARIASEMLGKPTMNVGLPRVFSEAYPRGSTPGDPHWDLHFVFSASWPGGALEAARGKLWKELRFVDVERTPAASFGRGHGDVLALVGLPPLSEAPA